MFPVYLSTSLYVCAIKFTREYFLGKEEEEIICKNKKTCGRRLRFLSLSLSLGTRIRFLRSWALPESIPTNLQTSLTLNDSQWHTRIHGASQLVFIATKPPARMSLREKTLKGALPCRLALPRIRPLSCLSRPYLLRQTTRILSPSLSLFRVHPPEEMQCVIRCNCRSQRKALLYLAGKSFVISILISVCIRVT